MTQSGEPSWRGATGVAARVIGFTEMSDGG